MTTKSASSHSEATRTEGAQRIQDRKHMMQPLAKIADRWASEEQQLDKSELEIRYRWAMDVKTVHASPDLYGRNAVEALFELRMTRDFEPRVYQSVANYIDADFFETVIAFNQTNTARKGHITWSHLVVFAWMGDRAIRQNLLEQCMAEQWSVATLRDRMDEAFVDDGAKSTTERRQAGVGSIAKRVARSAQKLEKDTMAIFGKEFRLSLDLVRESDREAACDLVEAAQHAISDCQVQLVTTEQALAAALKSLKARIGATKPAKAKTTESVPLKPMADDQTLPVEPEVKRRMRRVRRRVTPTVESQELVTV